MNRRSNGRRIERPRDDDVDAAVDEILDIRGLSAGVVVRHVDNPLDVDPVGVAKLFGLGAHVVFPGLVEGALTRVPAQSDRDVFRDGGGRSRYQGQRCNESFHHFLHSFCLGPPRTEISPS